MYRTLLFSVALLLGLLLLSSLIFFSTSARGTSIPIGTTPQPSLAGRIQFAPQQPLPPDAARGASILLDKTLGYRPPSVDLSHLTGERPPGTLAAAGLPARFDWRESGRVTPVRNQGDCGACYAFAALANFESRILIEENKTWDFSENHAKECNAQRASCSGGNFEMIANLLSQTGAAEEHCDPYQERSTPCTSSCPPRVTMLDWRIISGNAVPETDVLKYYIYNYGPIYTTLYAGFDEFTYYYDFDDSLDVLYYPYSAFPNHAVLIVGWDDNLEHAGGRGAWIVKNSWGPYWGTTAGYGRERGYFAIAYGSAGIGKYSSYIYDWQPFDPLGDLYLHDIKGWENSIGMGSTTSYGMVRFEPREETFAARVEFWTTDVTTDIDIYLYDDFSYDSSNIGTLSGLLASREDISFTEAGYHSVPLSELIPLSPDDDVFVAVKITNRSYKFPLAVTLEDTGGPETSYIGVGGPEGALETGWLNVNTYFGIEMGIRLRTTKVVPASYFPLLLTR
ncbi:MAG: hypothetical protein GX495_19620 [Chloroflexi bacterium]|jgi:C1A family cysteine protease|nr:hypothetical protein [Chloroflexota bacterium]